MFLRNTFSKQKTFLKKFHMSTDNSTKKPVLALPSTAEETVSFDINDTHKLTELGPVGKSLFFFY